MRLRTVSALAFALCLLAGGAASAGHNASVLGVIDGVSGPNFQLAARDGHITSPEGKTPSIYMRRPSSSRSRVAAESVSVANTGGNTSDWLSATSSKVQIRILTNFA